jgi:predicted PurR-regulated permease PerM
MPLIGAALIGYLLIPLVDRLHRYMPRVAAILVVYLVAFGALGGLGALIVPRAAAQISDLFVRLPDYALQLQGMTQDAQAWYDSLDLPVGTRGPLETGLSSAVAGLATTAQAFILNAVSVLTRTVLGAFDLVILPFWLFYLLKDQATMRQQALAALPANARADVREVGRIVSAILHNYIRVQALLALIVGLATTVGLLLVGSPYWLLLGVLYGFTEVVPTVGPIVGSIPGLLLAALTGDWALFVRVLIVYIMVQQVENALLVPRLQGANMEMSPALIILVILVGSQVAGLWGAVLAVPLAAMGRDIYGYLYRRFGEGLTPEAATAQISRDQPAGRRHPTRVGAV